MLTHTLPLSYTTVCKTKAFFLVRPPSGQWSSQNITAGLKLKWKIFFKIKKIFYIAPFLRNIKSARGQRSVSSLSHSWPILHWGEVQQLASISLLKLISIIAPGLSYPPLHRRRAAIGSPGRRSARGVQEKLLHQCPLTDNNEAK